MHIEKHTCLIHKFIAMGPYALRPSMHTLLFYAFTCAVVNVCRGYGTQRKCKAQVTCSTLKLRDTCSTPNAIITSSTKRYPKLFTA